MQIRLVLAILLFTIGCGAARGPHPSGTVPSSRVVVEKDGAMWVATWHLAAPARELRFERPAGAFRSRVFEVVTPGYRLERDGDLEVLRAAGEPARIIRVRFPEFDEELTREYEFFRRFSDGGVALYTGHLLAGPAATAQEPPCEDCLVRQFELVPPPGAAVVVGGRRSDSRLSWTDESGRGTYVYFGVVRPVASDDVISVIDPGLPGWLETRTREAIPRLFALYRDRLSAAPRTRPVVLFDYKASEAAGYSSGGGTLPGLIQLGVEGRAWERESTSALEQLLHFLAHESAHVWNGEIAHYEGTADAWMHEGSADAFAQRALRRLDVIGEARFLEYQTEAVNDCRRGLAVTALRESAARGEPRLAYTCGNVIALLTERSLQARGADLFDFWRLLIARARRQGGAYTADDYQAVWRSMGARDADVAELGAFLAGRMDAEALVEALRGRGVSVEEAPPPQAYSLSLARDTFARLMAADCKGRVGFRISNTGLLLDHDVKCGVLPGGATVVAIEGFDVRRDGHRAYDAVRERCERKQPVTVTLGDAGTAAREVAVACGEPQPARPAYVAITGMRAASGSPEPDQHPR